MNGAKLQDWQLVDWKTVNEDVRNLRQQIFVASKENNLKKVGNLQKLMLRSRANWLQSIRRVTQINKGKRTPGVDREIITTPEERVKLFY
jgi:RNA-directed DNA polymerase